MTSQRVERRRHILVAIAVLLVSMATCGAARADLTFTFSFSSAQTNLSGQLTTTDLINNSYYTILGITGTIDGFQIAGLEPIGSGQIPTDDKLFASGALLDTGGFGVEAANGMFLAHAPEQIQLDPFVASINGSAIYAAAIGGSFPLQGSFTVTEVKGVPEPATLGLVIVGLLGVWFAAFAYQRRRGGIAAAV